MANRINITLKQTLLDGEPFSSSLFEDVLHDFVDEMKESLDKDADDALICLVAEDNEAAVMLVEWDGRVLKNEVARERLKEMWRANYPINININININKLIPVFVEHLDQGMLCVAGVKWV